MELNTKHKGDITTLKIITALIEIGITVSIPWGDNARYDLVVDINGDFIRIQCKTGCLAKDNAIITFNTISHHPRDNKKRKDYIGDADYFGVYCPGTRKCYLVPVNHVGQEGRLRIKYPKNNQKAGVKFAEDYELRSRLAQWESNWFTPNRPSVQI